MRPPAAARECSAASPPVTLVDLLARAATRATQGEGLRFLDRAERPTWLPYAEVWRRAGQASAALMRHGVAPGDRVTLVLPTAPAFADAFFGTLLAGAVPVPLYPPVQLGRLDEFYDRTTAMLRAVGATVVIADARTAPLLGRILARARPDGGMLLAERLISHPDPVITVPAAREPDHLALIQFSSGTTMDPRPVALSHRQLLANTHSFQPVIAPPGAPQRPAGVSWLPLYHDFGLIGGLLGCLWEPLDLTLLPPELFLARPASWLRAISRYRATASPAPDFAFALCVRRIQDEELEGCDLSTWRLAFNGAEPVSPATCRAFVERFRHWGLSATAMTPVYGLAEAAAAVTCSAPDEPPRIFSVSRAELDRGRAVPAGGVAAAAPCVDLVSVGSPLPGARLEIRSADGSVLADGAVGRVWIRAPWLFQGYFGRNDAPLRDGWLDSGDLGFLWQGALFLTGRARDVLVVRGANHSPVEMERAVSQVAGVRTGCVVAAAVPSAAGERLALFVETRRPRRDSTSEQPPADLADACRRAALASTGLVVDTVVLLVPGTLPRTSSGKLRRGETVRRWVAGTLDPPRRLTRWGIALEVVRNALEGFRPSRRNPTV